MGRQIRFFMINEDFDMFVQNVSDLSDLIIDYKGNIVVKEEILNSNMASFFIKPYHSINVCDRSGYVNEIRSDVIQFLRCMTIKNQIMYGRLWYENKYFNETGNVIVKDKWLSDKFNIYKKWIVQNYRRSKEFDFYIGEATYKLYKDGEYKMMATPVTEVVFD